MAERMRLAGRTAVTEEEIARRHAKHRKLLRLPPSVAGETIVRGIERRKSRILVGSDGKVISLIARLLPVSYWKVLVRQINEE